MSSTINSSTSPAGLIQTSDGTASLKIQTGGVDAIFIDTDQSVTVNTSLTVAGESVLTSSDIDVANVLFSANIDVANVLFSSNIGSEVQAYDVDTAKLDVAQAFTAQQTFAELKETVFTLATSGTVDLNPANGSIQTTSLSNNITFTESLEAGQSVVLHIDDGSSYTVTFPTTTWVTSAGNTAPTLTANDTVVFWKISSTLYGAYVGSYA